MGEHARAALVRRKKRAMLHAICHIAIRIKYDNIITMIAPNVALKNPAIELPYIMPMNPIIISMNPTINSREIRNILKLPSHAVCCK